MSDVFLSFFFFLVLYFWKFSFVCTKHTKFTSAVLSHWLLCPVVYIVLDILSIAEHLVSHYLSLTIHWGEFLFAGQIQTGSQKEVKPAL